jgi:hypothetical protein
VLHRLFNDLQTSFHMYKLLKGTIIKDDAQMTIMIFHPIGLLKCHIGCACVSVKNSYKCKYSQPKEIILSTNFAFFIPSLSLPDAVWLDECVVWSNNSSI